MLTAGRLYLVVKSELPEEDVSRELDEVIRTEADRAVQAIARHMPFADIVYQLGVLAHYVADVNNPLNTSSADPNESDYFLDYLGYIDTARERFAVVFYGPPEGARIDVDGMVLRALDRGRVLYPKIGREYERVGGVGREPFDDRSEAFESMESSTTLPRSWSSPIRKARSGSIATCREIARAMEPTE